MTAGYASRNARSCGTRELERPHGRGSDDVRDGRAVDEQRALAEEVALAQPRALLAIDEHGRLAVEDHVEARTREALSLDATTGRERFLAERVRDGLQLRTTEVPEQVQPGDRGDDLVLVHRESPSPVRGGVPSVAVARRPGAPDRRAP